MAGVSYPNGWGKSSDLGTQLSLPGFHVDKNFQLVLRCFAALPGEHGHHPDDPAVGELRPLQADGFAVAAWEW